MNSRRLKIFESHAQILVVRPSDRSNGVSEVSRETLQDSTCRTGNPGETVVTGLMAQARVVTTKKLADK